MANTSSFNKTCKFFGIKLLLTKFAKFKNDAVEFTRFSSNISPLEAVKSGARIHHPLWMDVLRARSNRPLPFDKDVTYVKFWGDVFPNGKRYYIFKHKDGTMEFKSIV